MSMARMIGHYQVGDLLGEGGIGQVHAARDTVLGREVAIKSLRPELLGDKSFIERFRAEATHLARLNHPNITTLYSLLPDHGNLYMVMELVRGKTLETILTERGGRFELSEALAIIGQAADGLAYAHQMGVIHRDIKPANLIITPSGLLKIMDFGIARVQGSQRLTRDGSIVGTLAYMAPEQLRGADVDARSDLYSLAIVLYEMLSGAVPFSGASDYDLMQAQIHQPAEPVGARVRGLDAKVEKALMRALSKRPEDRHASLDIFKNSLGNTISPSDALNIAHKLTRLSAIPLRLGGPPGGTGAMTATAPPGSTFKVVLRSLTVGGAAALVIGAVIYFWFGQAEKASRERSVAEKSSIAPQPQLAAPSVPGKVASPMPGTTFVETARTERSPASNCNPLFPETCRTPAAAAIPPAPTPGNTPPPFRLAAESEVTRSAATSTAGTFKKLGDPGPNTGIAAARDAQQRNTDRARPIDEPATAAPPASPPPAASPTATASSAGSGISAQAADATATSPVATATAGAAQQMPLAEAPYPSASRSAAATTPTATDALAAYDEKNYVKAFEFAKPLAESGDPECQFIMGRLNYIGKPARKNNEAALEWYKRAADQGLARAQYNYAYMIENGEGTLPKKTLAAEYYRRAAEQDYPDAQFNLAVMFANGDGVDLNLEQARRWFSRAARSTTAPDVATQAKAILDKLADKSR